MQQPLRVLTLVSLLVLVLACVQCKHTPSASSPWIGEYELKGYDETSKLAFTGTMNVLSHEQNHIIANCLIRPEKDAPEGMFEQDGRCEGLVEGTKIEFDLAPFMDDAGLLLEGQLDTDRISGVWKLDGFVTSPPLGKFEAIKKP